MQKHGYGRCTKLDKHHYVSATIKRTCKDFVQADAETIQSREAKLGEK
jgi:hypothetical protein